MSVKLCVLNTDTRTEINLQDLQSRGKFVPMKLHSNRLKQK